MTFKPNAYLEEALRKRDIRQIRGALLGYADGDPAFRGGDFSAALDYVKRIMPEVFSPHDPSIFADDTKPLKEQYYDVRTALSFNFSKERLAELEELGRKCMGDAEVYTATGANDRAVFSPDSNTRKKAESQNQRMAAGLKIGLVCAAAVLVVIVILIPLLMKMVR